MGLCRVSGALLSRAVPKQCRTRMYESYRIFRGFAEGFRSQYASAAASNRAAMRWLASASVDDAVD